VSTRGGPYDVWKVPSTGGSATQVTVGSGLLGRPAPTPDGTGIGYARPATGSAFSEVVIQDLATGAIRVISSQRDGPPTFDRTGSQMVVASNRSGYPALWLLDVASGAVVRQLTTESENVGAASFGPFP
jgi:TolB protein